MKRFSNKAVIIIGADSDIGRATAFKFAKEDANCILVGINPDILKFIYKDLPQDHTWINTGNHMTITCDVSDAVQMTGLIKHVIEKYQHIDVVVNIDNNSDTNDYVMPELIKTKGNIVNVSTLAHIANDWSVATYLAKQHDLTSITKAQALKSAPNKVRVNAVTAGVIATDTNDNPFTIHSPLQQTATPNDITAAIVFLASDDAAMITGVNLPVDGGINASNA